jgi:beta-mannosidase
MNRVSVYIVVTALVAGLLFQSCGTRESFQTTQSMKLDSGWKFKMIDEEEWLPAQVPGTVHTDLLANDKIPQPFYRDNEKSLQWIDKKDWLYHCSFKVDTTLEQYTQAILNLKGLDTYAEVSLNGKVILSADNMFRSWNVDVSEIIKAGENELEILFKSPVEAGLNKLEIQGYGLPAANDQSENGELGDKKVSVFTRKAPYHYGWDWGPRFVTSGIWREVELLFVNHLRIENVYYKQNNILPKEASIDAVVNLDVIVDGDYTISVTSPDEKITYASTNLYLAKGANSVTLPFQIANPELWWPNGMGEQNLYSFRAKVANSSFIVDTLTTRAGLRSVRLVREPDSLGKSFYFEINGKPVFAKGANYIPNDNFLPRVTKEKYEHIISSAAEANMNMIRVWGGGIYENDIFYELCDRYGLMVWQDFMFACSMYPGNDEFLHSVYAEATENIIRLRNHPSIVMWCGNNEILTGWCPGGECGWGWKQRYTPEQREILWHGYDTLFHKILPDLVATYDGTREFWPSSPQADWGEKEGIETHSGDLHYWGVWHGQEPFSEFYNHVGRFMSEYGFQSFPGFQTVRKFTLPHDWDTESEVMKAHQRSGLGNARILEYMDQLYPVPEGFQEVLYLSQIQQAEGIKQAIHAHRAKKPYCMGTMFWQLNDCWPAASWSAIDYYGTLKALHYYAKRAYAPVIFSFIPGEDELVISVCSDLDATKISKVKLRVRNFEGEILKEWSHSPLIENDKVNYIDTIRLNDFTERFDPSEVYLQASLQMDENLPVEDIYFFTIPKNLSLSIADPEVDIKIAHDELTLTLRSDVLIRNLFVACDKQDIHFTDNYFDLLPNKEYTISAALEDGFIPEKKDLKFYSLNNLLHP